MEQLGSRKQVSVSETCKQSCSRQDTLSIRKKKSFSRSIQFIKIRGHVLISKLSDFVYYFDQEKEIIFETNSLFKIRGHVLILDFEKKKIFEFIRLCLCLNAAVNER